MFTDSKTVRVLLCGIVAILPFWCCCAVRSMTQGQAQVAASSAGHGHTGCHGHSSKSKESEKPESPDQSPQPGKCQCARHLDAFEMFSSAGKTVSMDLLAIPAFMMQPLLFECGMSRGDELRGAAPDRLGPLRPGGATAQSLFCVFTI